MFDKAPYKMMIDDSEISSTNYSNLNHRAGTDVVTAAMKQKNDRKGISARNADGKLNDREKRKLSTMTERQHRVKNSSSVIDS